MKGSSGCLIAPLGFLGKNAPGPRKPESQAQADIDPRGIGILTPSVEIVSSPGHGRTSLLWAMVFMLRQLSRVWPGYLCWPLDHTTGSSLLEIHEALRLGRLPEPWSSSDSLPHRFALHLRNMNPWGERQFVIWDAPDLAFTPERLGTTGTPRQVSWNKPFFWFLSLSDLDEVRARFLDLELDELIRVRHASGEVAREYPLRVVIVLTKGDAIGDLPPNLRCFLKEDPLARALATSEGGPFRARDELELEQPIGMNADYPEGDPISAYFRARNQIDELARDWMRSNSSGRALLARADDMNVKLKFSLVSATGSGFISGRQLATAWSPRRVLDPYFWALELGA